jgi:purine catabolism regulator
LSTDVGIKINEILASDYTKNSKIIAGKDAVDHIVNKINVMVDPDILEWANKGELLLSTSYFFKNAEVDRQKKLIQEMNNKGVSGLGIKLKPYLDTLPKEVLALANQLSFPIIEIDYEVSFTNIISPVLQSIYDEQSKVIRKVETIHKDNMAVVLKGGGIEDILKNLSRTMKNPIFIIDHLSEDILNSKDLDEGDEQQLTEAIEGFFGQKRKNKLISKTLERSIFIDGKEIPQLIVPIIAKNNVYGHIVLFGLNQSLTRFDILNIESSANIIALEFLKRLSVREVENKYKAEFFEDLISFDKKRINKAIERAGHYGFYKDAYYLVIQIDILNDTEDVDKEYLAQVINKSIYLINLICKDKKRSFLISNKGNSINILIMFENDIKIKKKTTSLVKNINQVLKSKISNLKSVIGVGRSYKGLESVYKSLDDAVKSVEAYGNYSKEEIVFFEDLGIYKIFCHEELKDELVGFYNENLKKLVEYDEKRDANLVKTLNMYFQQNGNLKRMSEELFTHYNTILYRMKRIQEICGIDINNRKERYDIETALEIHKIINA